MKNLKTSFFKSIFSPPPRTLVHLIPIYQNLHIFLFLFYFLFYFFHPVVLPFFSYIICCEPKVRFCFLPFSISFAFSPSYRTRERYQSWGRVLPPASAIYFSSLADPKGAMRRGSITKLNDLGNSALLFLPTLTLNVPRLWIEWNFYLQKHFSSFLKNKLEDLVLPCYSGPHNCDFKTRLVLRFCQIRQCRLKVSIHIIYMRRIMTVVCRLPRSTFIRALDK